jgi:hypothetical protein
VFTEAAWDPAVVLAWIKERFMKVVDLGQPTTLGKTALKPSLRCIPSLRFSHIKPYTA